MVVLIGVGNDIIKKRKKRIDKEDECSCEQIGSSTLYYCDEVIERHG